MRHSCWPIVIAALAGCGSDSTAGGGGPAESVVDGVAMTAAHNQVRAGVGVPDLEWSAELANVAQGWANHLAAADCDLAHSSTGYGENIFWSQGMSPTPADVVESWAGEQSCFVNGPFDSCSCTCGHYSQIVWRDTQRVGCGMASCPGNVQVWVCNYDPAGNVLGQTPF